MPGEILLQFDHGHAAFPLAVTAKAEALDHAVSAQMLVDGRAQCTGALRTAIHKHLRGNRMVKSFRLGRYGEGESGVTVVELK